MLDSKAAVAAIGSLKKMPSFSDIEIGLLDKEVVLPTPVWYWVKPSESSQHHYHSHSSINLVVNRAPCPTKEDSTCSDDEDCSPKIMQPANPSLWPIHQLHQTQGMLMPGWSCVYWVASNKWTSWCLTNILVQTTKFSCFPRQLHLDDQVWTAWYSSLEYAHELHLMWV